MAIPLLVAVVAAVIPLLTTATPVVTSRVSSAATATIPHLT